jgi:hypothetical protein
MRDRLLAFVLLALLAMTVLVQHAAAAEGASHVVTVLAATAYGQDCDGTMSGAACSNVCHGACPVAVTGDLVVIVPLGSQQVCVPVRAVRYHTRITPPERVPRLH